MDINKQAESHLFQKRFLPYLRKISLHAAYCVINEIYVVGIQGKKFEQACISFMKANPDVLIEYSVETTNTIFNINYKHD